MKKVLLFCVIVFAFSSNLLAQRGYNPNSVYPILEDDIMYRKTIWRLINLNEPQNKPFKARSDEENVLSNILLDGLKSQKLTPYQTNFLTEDQAFVRDLKMTYEDFAIAANATPDALDPDTANMFFGSDIELIEMREDVIFDKKRSRMYFDIQSLTLIVPNIDAGGIQDRRIAQMKFKEVHEYLSEVYDSSNENRAYWYNKNNNRRKMSYADAFDLRLFSSRIIKVSNPDGDYLNVQYPNITEELAKSQEIEYELMEFEHNLWEF
ncbi:MAG: gliding motility protein GldN [Thermonemataceae bacterium]